jgi:DNA-binding NarL/FixJ family response regulator
VSTPARILLADDHAGSREEIVAMLAAAPEFVVCAEVADAAAAVDEAVRKRPDLCLLDIRMPGSGIAAAWEISARLPATKVVMLTASDDDFDLLAALRAGACAYLLKDADSETLVSTLRKVLGGEAVISAALVARLVEEFRERGPKRRSLVADQSGRQLTSREWEVLELVRTGLTTAQIARRLSLTDATVRSHVAAVLKKLRVPDRAAAVRLFDGR